MRILVIDDMRVVREDKVEDHEVVYARNSAEALEIVKADQDWDIIHLDHDLGGVDTVKPVLDYFLEFSILFENVNFFVHTGNPYEQRSIVRQLEARGLFAVPIEAGRIFTNDYSLWAKANGLD